MPVRHLLSKLLSRRVEALLLLALTAGAPHLYSATKLVGTDANSGKLLYLVTPKTVVTIANTGAKPDGVVIAPNQQIIYALSGAGEIHSFNPYTQTDATLATGLTTPVNIVLEPGCKSILVSDIGVNKIFRIILSNHALTTFYNGPDKMVGLVYDSNGDLFVNDDTLNAIVEFNATGAIIGQTPSNFPLTTPDGLTYDHKANALFATSDTAQVIYKVSMDLSTVTPISFPGAPVLEGIVSDGHGTLYVVGVNGTTSTLFKYVIATSTQTTQNTVPGLDAVALIPFGPCIRVRGTDGVCEEMLDEEDTPPGSSPQ
jgi:sugar lactone lactonase YvrE